LLLHPPEGFSHAVAARLPVKQEGAATRLSADVDKAQKGEGLRFSKPTACPVCRCEATKLKQPGLVRVKRKRELLKP
jgi:hypothetical protein